MSSWKIFETSNLESGYRDWYDNFLTMGSTLFRKIAPSNLQAEITYLEQRSFNAVAQGNKDQFQIGINVAVPFILHYSFNNLFRCQTFLDHIGEATHEEPYRDLSTGIPLLLPDETNLLDLIHAGVSLSKPKDPVRAAAASAMATLAGTFMVYHEVAHLLLGHTRSAKKMFQELEYLEIFGSSVSRIDFELRQLWEMEADLLAGILLAADMLSPDNQPFLAQLSDQAEHDTPNHMEAIALALTALMVLFLLVDQPTLDHGHHAHPEPNVRFCAVASEIFNHLIQHYPDLIEDEELFTQLIDHVILQTDETWKALNIPARKLVDFESPETAFEEVERMLSRRQERCEEYRHNAIIYPFKP